MPYSDFLKSTISFCNSDSFKNLDINDQRRILKKTSDLKLKEYGENKKKKVVT